MIVRGALTVMPPTTAPVPEAPSSAARSSFNDDSEICNFASYAFGSVEISILVCSEDFGACSVGFGFAISALTRVAENTRQNANRRAFIRGSPYLMGVIVPGRSQRSARTINTPLAYFRPDL